MAFPLTSGEPLKALNDLLAVLPGGGTLSGIPTNSLGTTIDGSNLVSTINSQSEISWQTLYFSIASIALNIIAQPSGYVCGIRYPHAAYLRIAPFVCGWDACIKLCQMAYYSFREGPLSAASRIKDMGRDQAEGRGLGYPGTQRDEARTDEKTNALANVRLFLFLLGLVMPAIKIFASSNIPWSQAFVGMYLLSYATTELIEYLSIVAENGGRIRLHGLPEDHGRAILELHTIQNPEWESWKGPWCFYIKLPANHINFKMCLGHLGVVAQVITLGYSFKQIGYGTGRRFDLVALIVGETCTCLLFIYNFFRKDGMGYSWWMAMLRRFLSVPAMVIMMMTMAYLVSYFGPAYAGRATYLELVPDRTTYFLFFAVGSANSVAFILLLVLQIKENIGFVMKYFYSIFCWTTFVISLLHYRFAYDPTGTSTNAWVNALLGS